MCIVVIVLVSQHSTARPIRIHDLVMVSYYWTFDHTYQVHRTKSKDRSLTVWHYLALCTGNNYLDDRSRMRRPMTQWVATALVDPTQKGCYQFSNHDAVTAFIATIDVVDNGCSNSEFFDSLMKFTEPIKWRWSHLRCNITYHYEVLYHSCYHYPVSHRWRLGRAMHLAAHCSSPHFC